MTGSSTERRPNPDCPVPGNLLRTWYDKDRLAETPCVTAAWTTEPKLEEPHLRLLHDRYAPRATRSSVRAISSSPAQRSSCDCGPVVVTSSLLSGKFPILRRRRFHRFWSVAVGCVRITHRGDTRTGRIPERSSWMRSAGQLDVLALPSARSSQAQLLSNVGWP